MTQLLTFGDWFSLVCQCAFANGFEAPTREEIAAAYLECIDPVEAFWNWLDDPCAYWQLPDHQPHPGGIH